MVAPIVWGAASAGMWAWRSIQVARAAKTAHTAYKAGQVAKNTSVVVRGSSGAARAAVQASDDALTRMGAPATNAARGRAAAEGGRRGKGLVRDASLTAGTGGVTHAASSNASKNAAKQAEKRAAKQAKKQKKKDRNANVARNAGRFGGVNNANMQLPGAAPAVRTHTNPWARRL